MKNIIKTNVVLIGFIFLSACSGNSGSASDLADELAGQTFTVTGLQDAMSDCGSSVNDSTTGTDTGSISVGGTSPSPSTSMPMETAASKQANGASSNDDGIVVFSDTTYSYLENGSVVYTGSWSSLDANTLTLEVDGDTVNLDINVDGDTIDVMSINGDCSSGEPANLSDSSGTSTL